MPRTKRPGKGLPITLLVLGLLMMLAGTALVVLDARLNAQTGLDAAALHAVISGAKAAFRTAADQLAGAQGVGDTQAYADALFEQNLNTVLAPLSTLEQALMRSALFVLPLARYRWVLLGAGLVLLGVGLMLLARRKHGMWQSTQREHIPAMLPEEETAAMPGGDATRRRYPAPLPVEPPVWNAGEETAAGPVLLVQCPNCGAELRPGARFCNSCGQPISEPTEPAENPWAESYTAHP